VSTDVSEEHVASIFRVEKISSARNLLESRWQAEYSVLSHWHCHEEAVPLLPFGLEIFCELHLEALTELHSSMQNSHFHHASENHLGGKRFADDEKVETEVRKWLRQ
jgi:hypothetical protein